MREPLSSEEVDKIFYSATRKAAGRFYGFVEREDVWQVAHLVMAEKKRQVAQLVAEGHGSRLYSLLFKACMMYGHQEKATALGYKPEDLFFYSVRLLKDMIPAVLESFDGKGSFEYEYQDRATWVDISEALRALPASDYQIITWAFKGDPGSAGIENVARRLSITTDGARKRVNRILYRMRDSLGGENPYPRRHVKSNAAALAEIRNSWDG